ncbi:MAG: glycerol-3-phosphate 1-O-acyltransferase PlsY [Cytophagaceae bacterium]
MEIVIISIGILVAYLLGSLPTAVWYGKAFHGLDVRDYGSGNAGATNTFRVLGKRAGIIVMLVDILKGWTATNAAYFLAYFNAVSPENVVIFKLVFGIVAVAGHIFPVFERFKGGKGVATLLGMVLAIHIKAALVCILVFLVVFLLFKYVSLGSLISALTFPLILLSPKFSPESPIVLVFAFGMCAIVFFTHQKNIIRLLNGEENKAKLRIRKNNQ